MRSDRDRILDIMEAIDRIERHAHVEKSVFESDELIQTWMVYNIQIIGEAAAGVSDELRSQHPEVPWRSMASMRNVLVHAYFKVDLEEVWTVIQSDLPTLKAAIAQIATSEGYC